MQSSAESQKKGKKKKKSKQKDLFLPSGVQRFGESKKTGCLANFTVRQVAYFPEYKVQPCNINYFNSHDNCLFFSKASLRLLDEKSFRSSKNYLAKLRKNLAERLNAKDPDLVYEMRYYVRIPNVWAHSKHEVRFQVCSKSLIETLWI
jgi:hypothetical protein